MGAIDVSGGADGIAADCDAIRSLARHVGAAAHEIAHASLALHLYAADPALVTAGAVDPHDLLCFHADLLDALDGPRGLTWCAAQLGALDLALRAAADAYELADTLRTSAHDLVRGAVRLPPALAEAGPSLLRGDLSGAAQHVLTADPELADIAIDALQLAGVIKTASAALPDGRPAIRSTGTDRAGAAGYAPRSLATVLDDLALRNDGPHGAVDVRILSGHGKRRVIVDITGTKTIDPLPHEDVTGLLTDGKALLGQPTTYEAGVLAAMRRAGVTRADDVLLVGHSEGGMVAATVARAAAASGEFTITHVVTAGAPLGLVAAQIPRSVQVLALENAHDVVPHLDGTANPDRRNVTTVTGDAGCTGVVDCHSIQSTYRSIAADVDASDDRSVRAFRSSAAEYLDADQVETQTFVVTRQH